MARTLLYGPDNIQSATITRALLNTQTTGAAVVAKVIQGANLAFTQTGIDAGTGDVTINLTANPSISGTLAVAGAATFTSTLTANAVINSNVNFGNGWSAASLTARAAGTAQSQLGGVAFGATFTGTSDNGVRRVADVYGGNSGGWGGEYLSLAVGSGGATNDSANATIEQIRITGTQVLGRATTASTSTTTGALVLAGGVGIAGALNVGSTLGVTGAVTLTAAPILTALSGLVLGQGATAAKAVTIQSQTIAVTAANTLAAIPTTPQGLFFLLLVNGQAFLPVGASPPFTVSGTTITWSAANAGIALATSDLVQLLYI
jgi:hypothetical protein